MNGDRPSRHALLPLCSCLPHSSSTQALNPSASAFHSQAALHCYSSLLGVPCLVFVLSSIWFGFVWGFSVVDRCSFGLSLPCSALPVQRDVRFLSPQDGSASAAPVRSVSASASPGLLKRSGALCHVSPLRVPSLGVLRQPAPTASSFGVLRSASMLMSHHCGSASSS